MATENRPALGTIDCGGCGGVATVHKAQRGKGKHIYTRCEQCGTDQRTGAKWQTFLFDQTQWTGAPPEKPPNYIEAADWSPAGDKPKVATTDKPADETKKAASDPPAASPPVNMLLAIGGLVAVGVGGLFVSSKRKAVSAPQPKARGFYEFRN